MIRRVVELETPAHVEARVLAVSTPLLVGLSALVSVDTYLRERPAKQPVKIGGSYIGRRDFIQGIGSLDPRLEAAGASEVKPGMRRPEAYAADVQAEFGQSFTLDAGGSQAFDGREIASYNWKLEDEGN